MDLGRMKEGCPADSLPLPLARERADVKHVIFHRIFHGTPETRRATP